MREVARQDMFRFLKRYAKPDPIHRKRGGPVVANRCLTILKQAFNWAVVADYTDANVIDALTPRFVGGKETAGDRDVEKILNHSMQGVLAVYNRAEYAARARGRDDEVGD